MFVPPPTSLLLLLSTAHHPSQIPPEPLHRRLKRALHPSPHQLILQIPSHGKPMLTPVIELPLIPWLKLPLPEYLISLDLSGGRELAVDGACVEEKWGLGFGEVRLKVLGGLQKGWMRCHGHIRDVFEGEVKDVAAWMNLD